jgi:F-BAR domain only protein
VIGPNRTFVSNTPAPDEFTLDTSHLHKASVGFAYRAHSDESTSLAEHCPLALRPAWRPDGDKLGFVLQYRLNPSARGAGPVTLHNVVFVVSYEGARASGAQTKPAGTLLKDKHIVYWRMAELTLTGDWVKIVCRILGEQNAEPQPGKVEARWEYAVPQASAGEAGTGISVSRLGESKGKGKATEEEDDPFADESVASPKVTEGRGSWVDVPLVKKIVSGRYEAK